MNTSANKYFHKLLLRRKGLQVAVNFRSRVSLTVRLRTVLKSEQAQILKQTNFIYVKASL